MRRIEDSDVDDAKSTVVPVEPVFDADVANGTDRNDEGAGSNKRREERVEFDGVAAYGSDSNDEKDVQQKMKLEDPLKTLAVYWTDSSDDEMVEEVIPEEEEVGWNYDGDDERGANDNMAEEEEKDMFGKGDDIGGRRFELRYAEAMEVTEAVAEDEDEAALSAEDIFRSYFHPTSTDWTPTYSPDDTEKYPDYIPAPTCRRAVGRRSGPGCKVVDYVRLISDSDGDPINLLTDANSSEENGDSGEEEGGNGSVDEQKGDTGRRDGGMSIEEWENGTD